MRRSVCGLMMLAVSFSSAANAQSRCSAPADQAIFELQALKSELTVLAIDCKLDERYNDFVRRYLPVLGPNEKDFSGYFRRSFGGRAQPEQDSYITTLANSQSQDAIHQGVDYCPRNEVMFDEVMALRGPSELVEYAAGKDVVPAAAGACTTPAPLPARAAPARSRTTRGR